MLILTHPADVHADAVAAHLDATGVGVYRTDTATMGVEVPVAARLHGGVVTGRLGDCDLSEVTCVWHRRPSQFATEDPAEVDELRAGVGGVLACLPYLNHPVAMAAALKPYQLAVAGRCGLRVPETVVATDPTVAAALAGSGPVVVKSMATSGKLRLVRDGDRSGWSRLVHLTQRRVVKAWDVRLTVVDAEMFAARVESPHLDWREDESVCRYQPAVIPAEVVTGVERLMPALRLRYAAIDFAVDLDGRWWFLEANPNGQWLWIEQATGLPIAAAVAAALSRTGRVSTQEQ